MITTEHTADERLRVILCEAIQRFNHELMDDEERLLLLDRIKRLRKRWLSREGHSRGAAKSSPHACVPAPHLPRLILHAYNAGERATTTAVNAKTRTVAIRRER